MSNPEPPFFFQSSKLAFRDTSFQKEMRMNVSFVKVVCSDLFGIYNSRMLQHTHREFAKPAPVLFSLKQHHPCLVLPISSPFQGEYTGPCWIVEPSVDAKLPRLPVKQAS